MALKWLKRKLRFEDDFFEFNLQYLFIVGLWPMEHWSPSKAMLYKMYECTLHVLSFIYLLITGIGTYQHKGEISVLLSNLDMTLVAYNFVLKVAFFLWNREKLKALIAKIRSSGDKITENRKKLMSNHVIFISVVSTAIVGAFCALAQLKFELPVEVWLPFDPKKSRMNLILASQIIAFTFTVPCLYRSCSMQGIVCSLIMYVCDQLIELQEKLRNLEYSPQTETDMRKQFKEIIKKHIRLIEYSKEMENIFKEFLLVQHLAVTVELCLNATMVTVVGLNDKNLLASFLAFLGIALLNAYIYCYLGDEMIIQSKGVALAAYETAWTSWPVDLQKDLLIVIRAAQKPMKLTAGGMAAMSIQTYSQALYNGYSIFAVLNDVVD